MFEQYFYFIITFIAIMVLVSIYILIQKSKKEKSSLEKNLQNIDDKEEDEKEEITPIEEDIQTLETTEPVPSKQRTKAQVPQHGKISKENFKDFAGTRILVAEDNFINQKVISALLADTGVELIMADNGQIALNILEKDQDFCMVLMDAHMPVLDGFDTTREIRANPNYEHIVVVALSGDTAADDIKKMTDAGMEEHLEKPLQLDALYDVLYAYIKREDNGNNFIEVVNTKELDGEKGLKVCGGDDLFYKEILNEFLQNYSTSAKELHKLLENNAIQPADKLLLDIIGITANIGADPLNESAQKLKGIIQHRKKEIYGGLLDTYEYHLTLVIKDIKDYL